MRNAGQTKIRTRRAPAAFTLMEVLIVLAILAVIIGLVVPNLLGSKTKADINAAQGDGMTALHWAAFQDDVDMAKMLVAAGGNLKAVTRLEAITPLVMASKNGNAAMIGILLDGCADERDQPFILGATNFQVPSYKAGFLAVMKKLFELGVDEVRGHKMFAMSAAEYAFATRWLDSAGGRRRQLHHRADTQSRARNDPAGRRAAGDDCQLHHGVDG